MKDIFKSFVLLLVFFSSIVAMEDKDNNDSIKNNKGYVEFYIESNNLSLPVSGVLQHIKNHQIIKDEKGENKISGFHWYSNKNEIIFNGYKLNKIGKDLWVISSAITKEFHVGYLIYKGKNIGSKSFFPCNYKNQDFDNLFGTIQTNIIMPSLKNSYDYKDKKIYEFEVSVKKQKIKIVVSYSKISDKYFISSIYPVIEETKDDDLTNDILLGINEITKIEKQANAQVSENIIDKEKTSNIASIMQNILIGKICSLIEKSVDQEEMYLNIETILANNKVDLNKAGKNQEILLIVAAKKGYWQIANLLIEYGADAYQDDKFKKNAFDYAIESGDYFTVLGLIDINKIDKKYGSISSLFINLLKSPVAKISLDIISLLISYGIDIDYQDKDGYTALMYCAQHGFEDIARLLLNYNAEYNIENKSKKNKTALEIAINSKNKKIQKLIENRIKDKKEFISNFGIVDKNLAELMYAISIQDEKLVKNLLQDKEVLKIINQKDNIGQTPLYLACSNNNGQMVQLLIDGGASPVADYFGNNIKNIFKDNKSISGILGNKAKEFEDQEKKYKLDILSKLKDCIATDNLSKELLGQIGYIENLILNKDGDTLLIYCAKKNKAKIISQLLISRVEITKNFLKICFENQDSGVLKVLLDSEVVFNYFVDNYKKIDLNEEIKFIIEFAKTSNLAIFDKYKKQFGYLLSQNINNNKSRNDLKEKIDKQLELEKSKKEESVSLPDNKVCEDRKVELKNNSCTDKNVKNSENKIAFDYKEGIDNKYLKKISQNKKKKEKIYIKGEYGFNLFNVKKMIIFLFIFFPIAAYFAHDFKSNIANDLAQLPHEIKSINSKKIFQLPININNKHIKQSKALFIVAQSGQYDILKKLIKDGADVNFKDKNGDSVLILATLSNNFDIVQELIRNHADIDFQDDVMHSTALMYASVKGFSQTAKLLINSNASLNLRDKGKFTALMLATLKKHKEIVKLLIDAKADLNLQDERKATALMMACEINPEIANLLIDAGANIHLKDHENWTALMVAVQFGHRDLVKELILNGADIDVKNSQGLPLLDIAFKNGYVDIAKDLIFFFQSRKEEIKE